MMKEKFNTDPVQPLNVKDFIKELDDQMIGEIGKGSWQSLTICHGVKCLDHYGVTSYPHIRKKFESVRNLAGVYAYFSKKGDSQCIYIGMSKNLNERIYQHLLESCDVWGVYRYKDVFKQFDDEVDFYYLVLGDKSKEGEYLRSIVEKILQVKYKPILQSIKL